MTCQYPEISVVITCYHEGELLREAVESIRQQTGQPREIIIVNDASPDAVTNQVCHELGAEPDIKIIWRSQNGGPSIARNAGFAAAQGSILVPLDADDLLPPQALSHIHQAFTQHPDAGFIYGSYIRQDHPRQERLVLATPISIASMLRARRFSLSSNWTLIGTAPLRKSLWEAVGYSDPALGIEDLHDLEFWLRAMALPCQFYPISDVIYIWRKYLGKNSRQVTPMSWSRITQKHFQIYQNIGLEYRAWELQLLASKWAGETRDRKLYYQSLWRCIRQGSFQFSTWIILLTPAPIFRLLAHWVKR
ncbi:glycosyltransferase family 2 protein [Trichothermofontia sp.]